MKKFNLIIPLITVFFLLSCEKANHHQTLSSMDRAPVELSAGVDKARATLGDIITLGITVNWRRDLALDIPDFASRVTDLKVVDAGTEEILEIDGRKNQKKWIKLRADELGSYRIPALELVYKVPGSDEERTARTAAIFIEVESTLEGKDPEDLPNGIRPLVPIPRDYKNLIIAGIVLLLAGVLAYLFWRHRQRKRRREVEAPPLAHEVALRRLEDLKRAKASDLEAIRKLYFDLSEIFRRYLQDRFNFPAVDWTTEEILPHIRRHPGIQGEMEEISRAFFQNTDRVKFARHFPAPSEIGKEFETAERFIHNTKEAAGPLQEKHNERL